MHAKSVVSNSLWPYGLWPTRLFCPWDLPGKNTAISFSRGSSQPRDQTHVSFGAWKSPGEVAGNTLAEYWLSSKNLEKWVLVFYFFKIEVWLFYNVVLISAVQKSDSVICIYTFFFQYAFPLCFTIGYWLWFSVLCSRTLFIHSTYKNLYLLTPVSHFIPSPTPSSLATTSLFSMSMSLCFVDRFISILAWRIPSMDSTVHGVTKSQTWLNDFHFTSFVSYFRFHI